MSVVAEKTVAGWLTAARSRSGVIAWSWWRYRPRERLFERYEPNHERGRRGEKSKAYRGCRRSRRKAAKEVVLSLFP